MEFLGGTLALAKLEIQDTVGTVSNCLQRSSQMHSRFFQFVDWLPVSRRRAGLHQKERRFFDASHKIMLHGSIHRYRIIVFFMPAWIIIPGCDIHNILKFLIIQPVVIIHQVGSRRKIRSTCPDRRNLMFHEIYSPVCDKTFPVQSQCMKCVLAFW